MTDLSGQVALVTGGGRGLGAVVASALADAGADVAVMARDTCELTAVVEMLRAKGRRACGVTADVGDWLAVQDAVGTVEEQLGSVTILVNAAAVTTPLATVDDAHPQEWAKAIATNLNGSFYCAHATISGMLDAAWGRIFMITSPLATTVAPTMSAYAAAKAGLEHFTRVLAAELAETPLVAVTVDPGVLETRMALLNNGDATNPLDESAAIICWLCGPAGEERRGEVVRVTDTEIRRQAGLPVAEEDASAPRSRPDQPKRQGRKRS
ncbi:MAG TPA: SDR family NAD(P)-dependent oxidoreductase [Ktedonobacterales bacterium]|nr:SDR family NAD(P)-dependent oxidoreductase [Ktedonobacterales bacterium]